MADRHLQLVMRLAAAFPLDHVPDATLALYVSELEASRLDVLEVVMNNLMGHAHRFPTLAEIRESYNSELKREADNRPGLAEPPGVPMPEYVKKQIAEMTGKMEARSQELEENA